MTERDWVNDIHEGDAREALAEMPESSVHMAMCSPPYYGLRDYDAEGQIGLEDSLDEYIDELVAVGEELRRVLRPDGSWWLNLGDSYTGSWGAQSKGDEANHRDRGAYPEKNPSRGATLKRKNKMLVPHRVAIALQEAGWVVRNDVTWVKPNPMPSSVKDRLNTTTEQVFHLTPGPDYWYDLDAIREPHVEKRSSMPRENYAKEDDKRMANYGAGQDNAMECHPAGKNPGDVFEVTTKPFPEAHFAVYPPELCEKPIKATCPPQVCVECGAPYERETRDESGFTDGVCNACGASKSKHKQGSKNAESGSALSAGVRKCSNEVTVGWQQSCDCDTDATEAGIVCDPFAGAGTTCLVAKRLGRRFVGIDLNPEYVAMAQKRVGVTVDEPERLLGAEETALTSFGGTDD